MTDAERIAPCLSGRPKTQEIEMEWQPIDKAPTSTDAFGLGEYLLLYLPDHDGQAWVTMGLYFREETRDEQGRFKGGGWTGVDWDGMPTGHLKPTHWMPLPNPPAPPAP